MGNPEIIFAAATGTVRHAAPRRRRGGGSFSLIELLVVVAIIAMLAALLLPALNKAKETARLIVCQNNLKQRGVAVMAYVNDNDGMFPLGKPGGVGGSIFQMDLLIDDYLGGKYSAMICPSLKEPSLAYGDWQSRMAAQFGGGYGWTGPYYFDAGSGSRTFAFPQFGSGINHPNWVNSQLWTGVWDTGCAVCVDQIDKLKATSTAAICAEMFPIIGGCPGWLGTTYIDAGGNPRHGGNSFKPRVGNVLYADGHAKQNMSFKPDTPWNYFTWTDATP